MSHTPGPWKYNGRDAIVSETPVEGLSNSDDAYRYYGGHIVCESVTRTNAEFIVRACNSHDDLVAACEAINLALGDTSASAMVNLAYAWNLIDTALGKASGESNGE